MVSTITKGGCESVRPFLVVIAALLVAASGAANASAEGQRDPLPAITVRQADGIYSVSAVFAVPQPASAVIAVLTDYGEIPRFMPDVTTSIVRAREAGRAVVEQEAVSRVALFSKHVHVVLEISEEPNALYFRDRCGKSFVTYEGSWRLAERDAGTDVAYALTAKPSFAIPDLLLRRIFKRNAAQMIEQLRTEILVRRTRNLELRTRN